MIQINDKIGFLKILEFYSVPVHKNRGTKTWCKCICDCGQYVNRRKDYFAEHLIKNKNRQFSCGCKHPSKIAGSTHWNWKGYKHLSLGYYTNLQKNAEIRNLEFKVSMEYLWNLFEKQKYICAVSGILIKFTTSRRRNSKDTTASLDRIDSSKGYVEGNVQWVHKDINKMKNNLKLDYFIELCKAVAKQH